MALAGVCVREGKAGVMGWLGEFDIFIFIFIFLKKMKGGREKEKERKRVPDIRNEDDRMG